jgi:hypothetical protein
MKKPIETLLLLYQEYARHLLPDQEFHSPLNAGSPVAEKHGKGIYMNISIDGSGNRRAALLEVFNPDHQSNIPGEERGRIYFSFEAAEIEGEDSLEFDISPHDPNRANLITHTWVSLFHSMLGKIFEIQKS